MSSTAAPATTDAAAAAHTREDADFSSAGTRCAAWLYRPADATGDVPCVVMAHGFSCTREDRLPAFAERFAGAGLAVLVFDYRHFGASDGQPRQLLDIGRQQDDWRQAVAHARSLPGVDPGRIALWGSSFSGGHVVAVGAGLGSERSGIRAVVSQAPFADGIPVLAKVPPKNALIGTALGIKDLVGSWFGRGPTYLPAVGAPGTVAAMSAPEAEPGFAQIVGPGSLWRNAFAARLMLRIGTYRPRLQAHRLTVPLLVTIAEQDATTPPPAAQKMADSAPKGEVLRYPVGHFDVYVGETFERTVEDQLRFLRRHLLEA